MKKIINFFGYTFKLIFKKITFLTPRKIVIASIPLISVTYHNLNIYSTRISLLRIIDRLSTYSFCSHGVVMTFYFLVVELSIFAIDLCLKVQGGILIEFLIQ